MGAAIGAGAGWVLMLGGREVSAASDAGSCTIRWSPSDGARLLRQVRGSASSLTTRRAATARRRRRWWRTTRAMNRTPGAGSRPPGVDRGCAVGCVRAAGGGRRSRGRGRDCVRGLPRRPAVHWRRRCRASVGRGRVRGGVPRRGCLPWSGWSGWTGESEVRLGAGAETPGVYRLPLYHPEFFLIP